MLDIKYIRENPDEVKEALRKRNIPDTDSQIDELLQLDEKWREIKSDTDDLRSRRNKVSLAINKARKEGKDVDDLLQEAKALPAHISNNEAKSKELKTQIDRLLHVIPNILHESVPLGKDESENEVFEEVGSKPNFDFQVKDHIALLEPSGLLDLERAAKISGARWFFLKGQVAKLQMAIMNYAVDFISGKGYTLHLPPHFMRHEVYEGVINMGDFDESMYNIETDDQLHPIATSEHPLTAQFEGEQFDGKELPLALCGYSPCYRKEAGTHGKDDKGIFRVHQFHKVEQIYICKPEESWQKHDEMVKNSIEFWTSLGVPFRAVTLCSGDTGVVASKTVDLEVWLPSQERFREVCSVSNVLDYQARRLNMRYVDGQEKGFVHTLNGTITTDTRAIIAILENNQDAEGNVKIPEVLQKYCGFDKIEINK
jgi:seryl-tRNA synthetase